MPCGIQTDDCKRTFDESLFIISILHTNTIRILAYRAIYYNIVSWMIRVFNKSANRIKPLYSDARLPSLVSIIQTNVIVLNANCFRYFLYGSAHLFFFRIIGECDANTRNTRYYQND